MYSFGAIMTDYEHRKVMWIFLSNLFDDVDELDFIWLWSEDDMEEANQHPDGVTHHRCSGVVKGI